MATTTALTISDLTTFSLPRLQQLAEEIQACIIQMDGLWKKARQLLDMRIESISSQDLSLPIPPPTQRSPKRNLIPSIGMRIVQEANSTSLITALEQLALTGQCSKALKEWITDDMGTQGISRWYNHLGQNLTTLLSLAHPTLHHLIDATTLQVLSLRSHLRLHLSIPIPTSTTAALISDLSILRLLADAVATHAAAEANETFIFASWLLHQHRRLHDPSSDSARDAETKIAETDYPALLSYISTGLTKSRLNIFFGREAESVSAAPRRPRMVPRSEVVGAMLKRHRERSLQRVGGVVEYVNLRYLGLFVGDGVREVVERWVEADGEKNENRNHAGSGIGDGLEDEFVEEWLKE